MTALRVVAYLSASHHGYCAVYDPVRGCCDCDATSTELVTLAAAEREIAIRDKLIIELRAQLAAGLVKPAT